MEDEPNLRMLVMKKAAAGGRTGSAPLISPGPGYHDSARSRGGGDPGHDISGYSDPGRNRGGGTGDTYYITGNDAIFRGPGDHLVEQVGPDFSRLSRELNRVVLKIQHQAEVAADCPMHSHEPTSDIRRGSRTPEPGYLRRKSREIETTTTNQDSRRSLSSGLGTASSGSTSRLHQTGHRGSLHESSYQSLPRRLSKEPSKVDRRQSFQDFKTFRDKFVGRVEFKDTLRRSNEDANNKATTSAGGSRSSLRDLRSVGSQSRGRPQSGSDLRDFAAERSGGYLIETDFDFRSPPSTRDSSRDRSYLGGRSFEGRGLHETASPRRGQEQIYATPVRRPKDTEPIYVTTSSTSVVPVRRGREQPPEFYGESASAFAVPRRSDTLNDTGGGGVPMRRKELRVVISEPLSPAANGRHPGPEFDDPLSPTTPKDPLSPRRVEFAGEVFSFKTSRPSSRCESPVPKSILRHTNSDPSQRHPAHAATRSNTTDLSFCGPTVTVSRPTTLILPAGATSVYPHHQSEIGHNQTVGGNSDAAIQDNVNAGSNENVGKNDAVHCGQQVSSQDEQGDSDGTITEEKGQKDRREEEEYNLPEKRESRRVVPPPLADWNRSLSFPPGNATLHNSTAYAPLSGTLQHSASSLRKSSESMGLSQLSLISQSDVPLEAGLLRSDNSSLRCRLGDLEQQLVDNNMEIKCLKATLAECLRRIDDIEGVNSRVSSRGGQEGPQTRRPVSSNGAYPSQEPGRYYDSLNRRGSNAFR